MMIAVVAVAAATSFPDSNSGRAVAAGAAAAAVAAAEAIAVVVAMSVSPPFPSRLTLVSLTVQWLLPELCLFFYASSPQVLKGREALPLFVQS
jgi:hypothetical protein